MNRGDIITAIKCIGNSTVDNLPDILEPFSKYGKSVGILIKSIRDGVANAAQIKQLRTEAKEELKQVARQEKPPVYMDCVLFTCGKGMNLTKEQQENLRQILQQEFNHNDEKSCKVISMFTDEYMGGNIEVDSVDDCSIGEDYLSFNFSEDDGTEYPYHEGDLNMLMEAINTLLGANVFDGYIADGHDESWEE